MVPGADRAAARAPDVRAVWLVTAAWLVAVGFDVTAGIWALTTLLPKDCDEGLGWVGLLAAGAVGTVVAAGGLAALVRGRRRDPRSSRPWIAVAMALAILGTVGLAVLGVSALPAGSCPPPTNI